MVLREAGKILPEMKFDKAVIGHASGFVHTARGYGRATVTRRSRGCVRLLETSNQVIHRTLWVAERVDPGHNRPRVPVLVAQGQAQFLLTTIDRALLERAFLSTPRAA